MSIEHYLNTLESSGLIRIAQLQPEIEYLFRHALVQDAAYDSLLKADRKRLHRAVAETMERAYPERIEALAATLAHHFKAAGDDTRALHYFTLAAERALANYANQEAETLFRSALVLAQDDESQIHLLDGLGRALSRQGQFQEAVRALEQAIDLCLERGHLDTAGHLFARAINAARSGNDTSTAETLGQRGMKAIDPPLESAGYAALLCARSTTLYSTGHIEEALQHARQSVQIAQKTEDAAVQAEALLSLGSILSIQDEIEGIQMLERSVDLALSAGALDIAIRSAYRAGSGRFILLDLRRARQHYSQAVELARRIGDQSLEISCLGLWLWVEIVAGERTAADTIAAEIERLATVLNNSRMRIAALGTLALRDYYRGNWSRAREGFEAKLAVTRQTREFWFIRVDDNFLAEMAIQLGLWDDARAPLDEARRLPDTVILETVRTLVLSSAFCIHDGQLKEARRLLDQAGGLARRSPFSQLYVMEGEARLAVAEGRWDAMMAIFYNLLNFCDWYQLRQHWAIRLREWAEAHLARGEAGDFRKGHLLLRQARMMFEEMGCEGWVELMNQRLAQITTEETAHG